MKNGGGWMSQSNSKRFVDNSDGTITDTQTNLMWQKEDDGQKRTQEESKTYCNELSLGGHNGWRIPTINELKALSSYWKQVFATTKDDEPYWSNTVHTNPSPKASENQKYAAEVMFSSGETNQYFVVYHYYVRAVRKIIQTEQKSTIQTEQKNTATRNCSKCGEPIEEPYVECWNCAGDEPEESYSKDVEIQPPKSKKNNKLKTLIVIIGAIIWWVVLLVKNPSNLGPGITLGHLIQAFVIFIVASAIVKIIWRK